MTLDEPSIRAKGSFLGAAGIMVFDDTRNMVDVAHNAMEFFAEESCGKCFPCRIGTQRLTERLDQSTLPETQWRDEVEKALSSYKPKVYCLTKHNPKAKKDLIGKIGNKEVPLQVKSDKYEYSSIMEI